MFILRTCPASQRDIPMHAVLLTCPSAIPPIAHRRPGPQPGPYVWRRGCNGCNTVQYCIVCNLFSGHTLAPAASLFAAAPLSPPLASTPLASVIGTLFPRGSFRRSSSLSFGDQAAVVAQHGDVAQHEFLSNSNCFGIKRRDSLVFSQFLEFWDRDL